MNPTTPLIEREVIFVVRLRGGSATTT